MFGYLGRLLFVLGKKASKIRIHKVKQEKEAQYVSSKNWNIDEIKSLEWFEVPELFSELV